MYLDAGTNNQALPQRPALPRPAAAAPSTEELYAFVDEFVEAVQEVFPNCCIHFEDWTGSDAITCSRATATRCAATTTTSKARAVSRSPG